MTERPNINQKDIHMPQEEREVKIQLDRDRFDELQFLVVAQTPIKGIKNQKDIYYDFPDFRITNLNRGFRVRFDEGIPKCFEFKSLFYNPYARSENPWYVEEIEFTFPILGASIAKLDELLSRLQIPFEISNESSFYDYPTLDSIFHSFNLNPAINVTKHRSEYENDEAILTFDFIEELGYFLEVESKGGFDPITILNNHLKITDFRVIREGYNDMMLRGNPKCLPNEIKQSRFRTNPEWNILSTEVEYVQDLLRRTQ